MGINASENRFLAEVGPSGHFDLFVFINEFDHRHDNWWLPTLLKNSRNYQKSIEQTLPDYPRRQSESTILYRAKALARSGMRR